MLHAIGARSMDDLLVDIPRSLRLEGLKLPAGLSEFETMAHVSGLAARNRVFPDRLTFRGGGIYRRFIPAAVAAVTSKPEFYTAYTPYQPEASQGTLQAIYEFQTLIAELTGHGCRQRLPVRRRDGGRRGGHDGARPHRPRRGRGAPATCTPNTSRCSAPSARAGDQGPPRTASPRRPGRPAVIFQQPDFLGLLVDARRADRAAHRGGRAGHRLRRPDQPGVLAPPGEYGADIAVGEGQQLGLPPSYGGPHVGFIACRRGARAAPPGPAVGTGARRSRAARLRPHPHRARAAHPAREGHLQHLHQPLAVRAGRERLPDLHGTGRPAARWPRSASSGRTPWPSA